MKISMHFPVAWVFPCIMCMVVLSPAKGDWISLAMVESVLEFPSRERRLQVASMHAEYRSKVQAAGSSRLELRIPWERNKDSAPHDPASFQQVIDAEAKFIETLVDAALIDDDGVSELRLSGIVGRLQSDPVGGDLLQGSLPTVIERLVAYCTLGQSNQISNRYKKIAMSHAGLLGRLEAQMYAARSTWYSNTSALGGFVIDPGDTGNPTWRQAVRAWDTALAEAYESSGQYRRLLASEVRRATRSPQLVERAVAAQILRSMAGHGPDRLLAGIARHAALGNSFEGDQDAAEYVDAVIAALPDEAIAVRLIPGTSMRIPGSTAWASHALTEIKFGKLRSLEHLQIGVDAGPQPSARSEGSQAWPGIGQVTRFLAPPPAEIMRGLATLGVTDEHAQSCVADWTARRDAVTSRAYEEAPEHQLGHVESPEGMRFSSPDDVRRAVDWVRVSRADAASLDREFVASITQSIEQDRSGIVFRMLQSEMSIDFCRRSGIAVSRPDELQFDLIEFFRNQGVSLELIVDELASLAGHWTVFAEAELDHWYVTLQAAATRRLPGPVAPDWDQVPDRAAAQAELQREFLELLDRKREAQDRVSPRYVRLIAARRELIESQRRLVAMLIEAGLIFESQYDQASLPEAHERFSSLLAQAHDRVQQATFDEELLTRLIVEPAMAALESELDRLKAMALDGIGRPSRLARVFEDLETVSLMLIE